MSTRGPKPKSLENSRKAPPGSVPHETVDPPTDLTPRAMQEYERLVGVLRSAGTLERVDLGVVAECSRILDLLDRAHGLLKLGFDPKAVELVAKLTMQRRGLLRELGLTLQPSRTMFRAKPQGSERDDKSPWEGRLKVG